jgi:C1A family cysteine protease
MKVVLFLTALLAVAVSFESFGPNEDFKFSGMSVEQWASEYLMPLENAELEHTAVYNGDFSEDCNLDLREKFGDKIHGIRDQGSCGSCWAFATSEMASDRVAIDSDGAVDEVYSPQNLLNCDREEFGCGGAATQRVVGWMANNGVATDTCQSYKAVQQSCSTSCDDGSEAKLQQFSSDQIWQGESANVEEIMMALVEGPVYFSMQCASDFMTYSGGIFETKTGSYVGGHAVKAVGWGTDEVREDAGRDFIDSHYWIVANSWSERWGETGYFKIYMNQKIAYNAGYLRFGDKKAHTFVEATQ